MRLPPLRPYFRGWIECYIIFALLVAQDEVATSASILPWGAQDEVPTSASILPWEVDFYIICALLVAQDEVATSASILPWRDRILYNICFVSCAGWGCHLCVQTSVGGSILYNICFISCAG